MPKASKKPAAASTDGDISFLTGLETVETKKKADGPARVMIAGMRALGELKALETSLKAKMGVIEAEVRKGARNYFIATGLKTHTKPDNITGYEDGAEGSLQMRRSSSVLTPEQRKILDDNKIPFKTSDAKAETIRIKPQYMDLGVEENRKYLSHIGGLIKSGLVPADWFERVPGEVQHFATDETITEVYKTAKTAEQLDELLAVVCTPSITSKLTENVDRAEAFKNAIVRLLSDDLKKGAEEAIKEA